MIEYRYMNKLLLPIAWFSSTFILAIVILAVLLITTDVSSTKKTTTPFASNNQMVLGSSTVAIDAFDSRAATIDKVFAKYNCPLEGYGETFVKYADEYDIPFWLVASIAFQETSCGKNQPITAEGKLSNNFWGYGVWGKYVKAFDTVEDGIKAVSKYMSVNFYSQGVTNLCEIMKTYTPPSNGSWCRGVKYFGDEMLNYGG
jgi:hypothetical protein